MGGLDDRGFGGKGGASVGDLWMMYTHELATHVGKRITITHTLYVNTIESLCTYSSMRRV